jgi:hypothetical protein
MPTDGINTRMRDEALAYASRGLLVFPLWWIVDGACACRDKAACGNRPGKHPCIPGGVNRASNDERQVERWWTWRPHANIGMPMGANNLAAVDVDAGHGGYETLAILDAYCLERGVDPAATRAIGTGGGGEHRIYWQPAGGIPSKRRAFGDDAPGVDTRGRGGYLVAPPSLHASGRRYEVIDNGHTIAPWPAPLTALLEQAPRDETGLPEGVIACGPPGAQLSDRGRGAVWAFAALLEESKKIADWPLAEGSGKNDALNASAYKLGRRVGAGYIDEASCEQALYQAASRWIGHGHTDRSIRATIRSGLTAGIRKPHPGPATRGAAS